MVVDEIKEKLAVDLSFTLGRERGNWKGDEAERSSNEGCFSSLGHNS
jgi:hypothetical protein